MPVSSIAVAITVTIAVAISNVNVAVAKRPRGCSARNWGHEEARAKGHAFERDAVHLGQRVGSHRRLLLRLLRLLVGASPSARGFHAAEEVVAGAPLHSPRAAPPLRRRRQRHPPRPQVGGARDGVLN